MKKPKRRFIAGATCPECHELDSLQWWEEQSVEWVECVTCGYTKQRLEKKVEQALGEQQVIGLFTPE